MKTLFALLAAAALVVLCSGCTLNLFVSNHDGSTGDVAAAIEQATEVSPKITPAPASLVPEIKTSPLKLLPASRPAPKLVIPKE